ncbi:MAG: hypothetical protein P8O22_10365 [Akkermansiaceae bacterium]|nr:hypothetical protein [Akkermansiaceae bacterium]
MSSRFDSLETGEAFRHCCACDCNLTEVSMYIVNKSFAGDECVYEMAMCINCREAMNEKLSEESRVAMFDFIHDHANIDEREQKLGSDADVADYISHCITCDTDVSSLKNYSLGGMFAGEDLIKGVFPMLMCDKCEEKLNETISEETREVWDRFIGEHFPGPPSEVRLPTHKPVLI